MKLVATSDWHADASTAGLDRFDDIEQSARETADIAVRERADLYAFTGDLANPDNPRSHRATALAIDIARHLARHEIASIWIPGNHDVVEDGRRTSTLSPLLAASKQYDGRPGLISVCDAPGIRRFWDGFAAVALPYTARANDYDPDASVRKMSALVGSDERVIVLSHLMIEGIGKGSETTDMARGRDVFLPIEAIRECWPSAVIVNGHYHHRQRFAGVWIPGSLGRLRFDEEKHEPGCLILELGDAKA